MNTMESIGKRIVAWATGLVLLTCGLVSAPELASAATSSAVVLNEVRCDDVRPDFVEVYNTGTTSVNLAGWMIADHLGDITDPYHVETLGSIVIGPKKYFRVYRGSRTIDFSFNITCGADDIKLANITAGEIKILDSVEIPPLAKGYSWGRSSAARNGWAATFPTPGALNKPTPANSTFDPASWIFDPQTVKRIDLTLPNATVSAFQNGNPGNVYQSATFSMQNVSNPLPSSAPLQVGIRLKNGYGSYRPFGTLSNPSKSSFKIKFDTQITGQRFFGIKKLTLNNMVQDPSTVHEWASYTLFRALGIPAPRVGYASVFINNVYWGYYLTLEPFDDVSLAWNYPSTQHLYEGLWTDRPSDLAPGRATIAYQIDEGSATNRTDLETLITTLNKYSMSSTQVRKVLNIDEVAKHMAIEQFLNHWDGYTSTQWWTPNNYYLHSDRDGMFELLPWGTDQTFGGSAADFSQAIGLLFKKCYADEYCKSLYLQAIALVIKTANALKLDNTISVILTVQKDSVSADSRAGLSYESAVASSKGVAAHVQSATLQGQAFLKTNAKGDIKWQPPVSLQAGTYLTSAFFNAYSDVDGKFRYSVAVGRYLRAGTLKVIVTFTPTDLANYTVQTKTVYIPVVN